MIWMRATKFQCEDEISTWQSDCTETWKNDEENIPAFSPACEMPRLSDADKEAYLDFRHQLLVVDQGVAHFVLRHSALEGDRDHVAVDGYDFAFGCHKIR